MQHHNLGYLYFRGLYNVRNSHLTVIPKIVNDILNTTELPQVEPDIECQKLSFYSTYPGLVTGTGISHGVKGEDDDFKMGMIFDHTSGAPIIQGSSVKGVLRSAFPDMNYNKSTQQYSCKSPLDEVKLRWIIAANKSTEDENISPVEEDIEPDEINEIGQLTDTIFEGYSDRSKGIYYSMYKRDVFHHATFECTSKQLFAKDAITPHIKEGLSYEESMLKNPKPLRMLKITSNNKVIFHFDLKDHVLMSADEKLSLFKKILLHYGIGAKTNVGYGRLALNALAENRSTQNPLVTSTYSNNSNEGIHGNRNDNSSYDPLQSKMDAIEEEKALAKKRAEEHKKQEEARKNNELIQQKKLENRKELSETGELDRPYYGVVSRIEGSKYFIRIDELNIELDRDIKKELKKGIKISSGAKLIVTFQSFKKPMLYVVSLDKR